MQTMNWDSQCSSASCGECNSSPTFWHQGTRISLQLKEFGLMSVIRLNSVQNVFFFFGGKTYFKPDCSSIVVTKSFHSIHIVALQPRLKAGVVCILRIVTFSSWRGEQEGEMCHCVGTNAFQLNANQTEAKTARPTEAQHFQRYRVTQSEQVSCFFFHFFVFGSAWRLLNMKQKAVLFGSGTAGVCLMSPPAVGPLRLRSRVSQAFPDHLLTQDLPAQSEQAQREGCST